MKAKHLLLALLACCAFVACDDEEGNKVDLNSQRIYITGVDNYNTTSTNKKAEASGRRLTAHEICVMDSVMLWCCGGKEEGNTKIQFFITPEIAGDGSIDTVQNRLGMRVIEVMEQEALFGNILNSSLYGRTDYYITQFINNEDGQSKGYDTVAYIPTARVDSAFLAMDKLYDDRDNHWSEIFEIYQNGFIFIPCTGAEYRELQKQGKQ